MTQGRESIADQVEELVQEERHSREQADTPARLEVSRAHAVAHRVTETPADLPNIIAQLREGSQLDAGEALRALNTKPPSAPCPLEPIAQSTE